MKKYIIVLLTLPLLATSCLKDDDDKFDKSASERMKEYLDNTSKVLSAAPNGWVVDYYPSPDQDYGGIRMYMKFDATKNTVVIASEAGAADAAEESYYSFGEDYGPTLNFDTYNELFHYYSKPQGSIGSGNVGWGGDYEFIIMSVDPDKVVLCGKKTKNNIVLTPAATADWASDFKAYRTAAEKMDEMGSYQMVIGSKTFLMSRDAVAGYRSRHFTINTTPAVSVGYIYTPTGIKFYEPVTIDNVTISEMTWQNGEFVDEKSGSKIVPIRTSHTFAVTTSNVQIKSADVSVKPSSSEVYYVIGSYPAADAQTKNDARIMNELASKVTLEELYQKEVKNVTLKLKAETEYIACAFAVTIVNGYIYPTSALSKSAPFTTLPDVPMEPGYEAWLGTWTVVSTSSEKTSKSLTFDITITENDRNKSVFINGWSICMFRLDPELYGMATYESNGELAFVNEYYLFDVSGYKLNWTNRFHYSGGYNTIGGEFTPMWLTLGANKTSARSREYSSTHPELGAWNITGMDYMYFNEAGSYGWYDPAEGFVDGDFAVGPFTLTKKSGPASVAPKSVVAKPKSDYNKVFMTSDYRSVRR